MTDCVSHEACARPELDVGAIARRWGDALLAEAPFGADARRVLAAVRRCRTAELGGHLDVCTACGHERPSYDSCRDRHCPKCQWTAQQRWLTRRMKRLLPVPYFHVVFTLPSELRKLARAHRAVVYDLLMDAAAHTLLQLGRDPRRMGGEIGVTSVLHTWTRDLRLHPHVHSVVTAGALSKDGERWIASRPDFLFPAAVMRALFRGKLLAALDAARRRGELTGADAGDDAAWQTLLDTLRAKKWVVYCKPPFGGPEQVFRYLGRYTHRVAISNRRLVAVDEHRVRFRTRNGGEVELPPKEFLRRFLDHALPPGFVKIRHYGLVSSSHATTRLEVARCRIEHRPVPCNIVADGLTHQDASPSGAVDVDADAVTAVAAPAPCPRCGATSILRVGIKARRERAPPAAAGVAA